MQALAAKSLSLSGTFFVLAWGVISPAQSATVELVPFATLSSSAQVLDFEQLPIGFPQAETFEIVSGVTVEGPGLLVDSSGAPTDPNGGIAGNRLAFNNFSEPDRTTLSFRFDNPVSQFGFGFGVPLSPDPAVTLNLRVLAVDGSEIGALQAPTGSIGSGILGGSVAFQIDEGAAAQLVEIDLFSVVQPGTTLQIDNVTFDPPAIPGLAPVVPDFSFDPFLPSQGTPGDNTPTAVPTPTATAAGGLLFFLGWARRRRK